MRRLAALAGALLCVGLLGAIEASAQSTINRAPNQDYVAMGDSYSSGNGTNDYYEEDPCYRSNFAYGPLIDPQIPGTFSHPACSGARTPHIATSSQEGYPPQVQLLGGNTDYVSLTIGGNDAGFTDALTNCAVPFGGCADPGGSLDQAQDFIRNDLPPLLDANYAAIRQAAPNTVVTVVGYPRIFRPNASCNLVFSTTEVNKANATADLLSDVTRARVQAAGPGFAYVDSRAAYFGHGACDSAEWINGFSASDTIGSYHPNRDGYQGYGGLTASTLLSQRRVGQTTGPNARIAFTSTRDGNSEVYAINGNGDFPVNLTNDPGTDTDPAYSPDGTKLAFASGRDGDNEIYVLDLASGGLTKLTSNTANDGEPDWSPNGDLLTFRSNRTGNDEIFKMTATGGGQTNLTNNAAADQAPDWSPDGSEIAFQRVVSGANTDVIRMSSDGQGQLNLTAAPAGNIDGQPTWAPNGNLIAFASNRDGDFEIFTVGRAAPAAIPAVAGPTPVQRTSNTASDREPAYSPDGATASFTSNRDGNDEIYTAATAGAGTWTAQTRRTDVAAGDTLPSWQGDAAAPQTSITAGPSGTTNLTTPTFEFDSSEPGSSFACRVDAASYAPCGSPFTTSTLGDGAHTFYVRATDPSGNADPTPASRTFTVDATPANTAITSGPTGVTNDATPTFEFSSDDPMALFFVCQVDAGPPLPCTSPYTTQPLADGEHTFSVLGTDSAGNPDAQPATAMFTVDATPPETTIDFAPPALTNDPTPSFEFSADEDGSTFECRLDGGDWAECATPQEYPDPLDDGPHELEVRATDAAGNPDPSPDTSSFTVDTAAPETTITSPDPGRNDNTPTFTFSSGEAGSFECRIDTGTFQSCDTGFTAPTLADGDHTFEVRATDGAGNTDGTPASVAFSIDATAPQSSITAGPGRTTLGELTNDDTPTFAFGSDDPGASFECRVDSGDWSACDQTFTTSELDDGPHEFEVQATDEFGNVDGTPASASFTVDATDPETEITDGVPSRTGDSTPSFDFSSSSDPGADYECRVDAEPFTVCTSPATTAVLGDGAHSFEVRSVDEATNRDATPAKADFTVDTVAPESEITAGPTGAGNDPTPSFSFSADGGVASFECRVDSTDDGDWNPCSSPRELDPLADGTHTFEVRATDDVDNVEATPAARTFSVDTQAPETTIDSGPGGPTRDAAPRFAFSSSESAGGFQCSLDGAPFTSCDSGVQAPALADGDHRFEVRARDGVGNSDPTPAARSFRVDTQVSGAAFTVKRKQRMGKGKLRIKAKAAAGEPADIVVSGTIKLRRKSFALAGLTSAVEPGHTSILRLVPATGKSTRTIRRALAKGKRVRATVSLTFTDGLGNQTVQQRFVRLR